MENNLNENRNNYVEKNNKGVKALLITLILLVLALLLLFGYKFFILDNKDNNSNNHNVVDNNNNNEQEVTISKELEEKIAKDLKEIPYSSIIKNGVSYSKLYEEYVLSNVFKELKDTEDFKCNGDNINANDIVEEIYIRCGYTKDQIKNVYNNKKFYENMGGAWYPTLYKASTIINKVKELYNYNLSYTSSKYEYFEDLPHPLTYSFIYEKELDVFVVNGPGGTVCGWSDNIVILDSKFADGIYTVKYIDTRYTWSDVGLGCNVINKDNKETKISCFRKECGENVETLDDDLNNYPLYTFCYRR